MRIDKIREEGAKINIDETNEYISELYSKNEYKISSEYPTIDTISCILEKDENCFKYLAQGILPLGPPVKYQNKAYGFRERFILSSKKLKLDVCNGVSTINSIFNSDFENKGRINQLKAIDLKEIGFHRAIIPLLSSGKSPMNYIKTCGFNVGSSTRVAGYLEINIKGNRFGIYDYEVNGQKSIIIDCYDKGSIEEFKKYVNTINYCLALVSGFFAGDEMIIIQSNSYDFININGFSYETIKKSSEGVSIINPEIYMVYNQEKRRTTYLKSEVFESLVVESLMDIRLFRAIEIMCESSIYPMEIKASTYSVALETIKNINIEKNSERINPFKEKINAKEAIKEMKKYINDLDDDKFNNKEMVLKKIEQLNQIGNKDSLLLSFKLLDIKLTDDDKRCINMRNDFLHGKFPFEQKKNNYELEYVVYRLHMLILSLIMKHIGYSGPILNNIKLADFLYYKKDIDEPLFRYI